MSIGLIVGVILIIVLLCCCCFLFMAAATPSSGVRVIENDSNTNTPQSIPGSPSRRADIFDIADTIDLGNTTLRVNEFLDNVQSEQEFIDPGQGKKFVSVDVSVGFKGNGSQYIGIYDFILQGEDEYTYTPSIFEVKSPEFHGADLSRGETVRGWLTFEVPEDQDEFVLSFEPGFLSTEKAKVSLN